MIIGSKKKAQAKIIKNRKDMINRHISIAKNLQGVALNALLKNSDSDNMSIKDIREVLKMATDLERISYGMVENDISNTLSVVISGEDEIAK